MRAINGVIDTPVSSSGCWAVRLLRLAWRILSLSIAPSTATAGGGGGWALVCRTPPAPHPSSQATLNAFSRIDPDGARAAAAKLDAADRDGAAVGALQGVVVGVKDILDVAGLPTR